MTHPGWSFFQDSFAPPDLWAVDRALQAELRRRLPPELAAKAAPALEALGKATAGELARLVVEAEAQEPEHVPYDPWGRRVDEIRTSRAWDDLKTFSAQHGIVATGYDESYGEHRRIVQAAVLHIFSASSAIYSCPLAMTDAAARVLLDQGASGGAPPALVKRLVAGLLSREPATFITSGQWMTERTGGSDVGGTSTIARRVPGTSGESERWTLHGTKWFTSAVTSEMALTLARVVDDDGKFVDGSKGLTLFCVEIARDASAAAKGAQGAGPADATRAGWRGIVVNRLKDKLGTRALPTAELTLDGVEAVRLGDIGRGVANIAGMLNVTRFYNSVASSSTMHKAHAWARAYAWKRTAFGAPIASHALHAATLDDMEAETAGALALVMELATLLGRLEAGKASDDEKKRLRALVPIAKLVTGKQAVAVASEALEAFGGAGYIEDTGLPALLRDAQVLPIWEGTTNVLSLDVLRAEMKDQAYSALVADMLARVERLPASLPPSSRGAVDVLRATAQAVAAKAKSAVESGTIEASARKLALTTGHCLEALYVGETAAAVKSADCVTRFERFVNARLAGPLGL